MNRTSLIATTAVLLVGTSIGAVAASASPAPARTHTLRFTTHTLSSKNVGDRLIETDRLVRAGTTIGFSANTCVFDFAAHRAHCMVTVARLDGQLRVKATVDADTGTATGRVMGGTGAYRGATGTISGVPGSAPNTSRLTVHWQS